MGLPVLGPQLSRTRGTGAAALAALVAAAVAPVAGCGGRSAPEPHRQVARTVALEGLSVSQFEGTALERRLRADQLLVHPKRFGVFGVAGLDELVLTRARLELLDPSGASPAPGGERAVLSRRMVETAAAGRRIAGASIDGLEVEVTRGGAVRARVSAARGTLEIRTGDLVLDGFTVEQLEPAPRSIRGARAAWRMRERAIVVDGPYELREGGRVTGGTGLRIPLGG